MTRTLPPNVSKGAKRRYRGSPKGTFLKQTGGDREKARELRSAERKLVQRNRLRRANKRAMRNGEEGWNTPKAIRQAEKSNSYNKKTTKYPKGWNDWAKTKEGRGRVNGSNAVHAGNAIKKNPFAKAQHKSLVDNNPYNQGHSNAKGAFKAGTSLLPKSKKTKVASAAKRRTSVSGKRAV